MTSQTPPTQQPSEALSPADTTDDYSLADYRPDSTIRWGLPQFFVGLAVFVVIIAAMNLLALALPRGAQGPLLFVAVLVGYGALFGSLARDFGLRFRPIDLLIGLGIGLAAKIVGVIVAVPLVGLSGGTPTSNVPLQNDLVWIVLNTVVATTLVAPIVEELFFRGLLLRAVRNGILRGRATHPRTEPPSPSRVRSALLGSVLISSAAFMLVHLYQAPDLATLFVLGSSTLILGLVNAVLATRTGRLGPGIVAHAVFNGLALLGLLAIS
jgi:membrane protease YdiL (CAAX protease family)